MKKTYKDYGLIFAIFSAILFGISTPLAKAFLDIVNPWLLAGLFYLGSGLGIFIILLVNTIHGKNKKEHFYRKDFWLLFLVTIIGGGLAPLFLMYGLIQISASSASLLLNLEAVFTALCAWIIFKEHTSRRLIAGMVLIVLGSILLTWSGHAMTSNIYGVISVSIACLLWALDNNVTRIISGLDPLKIVCIKSLGAGSVNTIIAFLLGAKFSIQPEIIASSMLVGFICYGISLVCFVLALRHIGTARTGAYFSSAPFIGAILAIVMFGEPITLQLITAVFLMGIGVYMHLTEEHSHEHTHEKMIHSHSHAHDDHHQHAHSDDDSVDEPHVHLHEHEPLKHFHPHYPDIHHRHKH
jgi:drug/metabolite transporter (DMT)-like permease